MTTVHAETETGCPSLFLFATDYGLTVEMVKERFAGL